MIHDVRDPDRVVEPLVDRIGRLVGAHVADTPPTPMRTAPRVVLILLSPLLILLMGSGFGFLIYSLLECQWSRDWPTAQGIIEQSGVRQRTERSARGRPMRLTGTSVVYEYTVIDKKHVSSRLTFGDRDNYAFLARALAAKYEPGQQVTVYYDPQHPDYSVLVRDVPASTYALGLVGLFLGFIGLRMFLIPAIPVNALSNSRWAPWSYRATWPDLIAVPCAVIALLLWLPSVIGV